VIFPAAPDANRAGLRLILPRFGAPLSLSKAPHDRFPTWAAKRTHLE